jgi:hypothetical protein
VQTEFDDEEDNRVRLIVHHTKPPFVDGRVTFSKQLSTVAIVKDPGSDMCLISKKGKPACPPLFCCPQGDIAVSSVNAPFQSLND